MKFLKEVYIDKGILHLDGKKKFLISADYPYYRDKRNNWEDRLINLKKANIDIITCYIPWRHHAIAGNGGIDFDFEGRTQGNRDIKYFVRLCKKFSLYLIVKPGPFILAETNYDGMPDYVNPDNNRSIEPMLNSKYEKNIMDNPLPAPLGNKFKVFVKDWYEAVDKELISSNVYPDGNIIAVQILNEGIYSNIQMSPFEYDYSEASIRLFREMLEKKYQSIEEYNKVNATSHCEFNEINPPVMWEEPSNLKGLLRYIDWSEYQSFYMKKIYEEYGSFIRTNVPFLANVCAPLKVEQGLDYWLTRVQPEKWDNVEYGFTNWTGVVSHDESAFNRHLLMAKRQKGPDLEENWGFSKLYDYRYKYPIIPFFQTVLAIAAGATGFNIYTGVGTANWDDNLDNRFEKPYPDCSPITHTGKITHKYRVLQLLTNYLQTYGEEILESTTNILLTYGLYLPYAYIASWSHRDTEWCGLNHNPCRCGYKGLDAFQYNARSKNYDFSMINLQTCGIEELTKNSVVTLVGGFFMEEKVQKKLINYVKMGGKLILLNEVPIYNEKFGQCMLLKEALYSHVEIERLEKVKVDNVNEVLGCTYILDGVIGDILYTVDSRPIGYRTKAGKGAAYFISSNLFDNDNQISSLFIDLINRITDSNALIVDDNDTQAFCFNHATKDVKHIFIMSKSEEGKWHNVRLRNEANQYECLRIRLPAKSAAIIRIENRKLTSYLAKGVNEYYGSCVAVEIEYEGVKYQNDEQCDVLFKDECGVVTKHIVNCTELLNVHR